MKSKLEIAAEEARLGSPAAFDYSNRCGVCGAVLTEIRGRFVGQPKRKVCATCCAERLDAINEMSSRTYGIAYSMVNLQALSEPQSGEADEK